MIGTKVINSINRNIVECKGCYQIGFCANFSVLIETLWNVKSCRTASAVGKEKVLIETLWNVKLINSCQSHRFIIVLIETLWNVKFKQHSSFSKFSLSINRNIVECKVFNIMHDFSVVMTVLIETLWNVKVSADCLYLSAVPVLIETLWNVKRKLWEEFGYVWKY